MLKTFIILIIMSSAHSSASTTMEVNLPSMDACNAKASDLFKTIDRNHGALLRTISITCIEKESN